MDIKLDGANLSNARVAADLSRASLMQANLDGINLSDGKPMPDSRRHHLVLSSAKLDGATLKNAGLILAGVMLARGRS